MEIKLFNSLTKTDEVFEPVNSDKVSMYSCGPTVYNYAHIGNMRAFLFADLLQRVVRMVGKYDMNWVMNITNIDDKTIRDSAIGSAEWRDEMGKQTADPKENLSMLTEFYRKSFMDDIAKLGIESKHFFAMPKATDYIEQMQDLIIKIVGNGFAYASEGSVYFNV
ncbi:MAG: cysteine--tRNA ligase, partial [Chlorobi bacterium]|nr:cysteine--tRNA ligase [Chlorobiota bacterium]